MNRKRTLSLALFFALSAYLFWEDSSLKYASVKIQTSSYAERTPSSNRNPKEELVTSFGELEKSDLASEKIKAIYQLNEFHAASPDYTAENILKRQAMLDELVKNAKETVQAFSKILQTSKDDGLKSFLLNLTMNSKLEDEEKSEIFLARLKVGATISKEGLVPDEELSFMIGFSHLSRLEDQGVRERALDELKGEQSLISNAGFRQIYKDYFNETP